MVKCTRCGRLMENSEWQIHECKNMRNLNELPQELLMAIINGEMTEEEAFNTLDEEISFQLSNGQGRRA